MSRIECERSTALARTARVLQIEGIFELERAEHSRRRWVVDLPLEERAWRIGMIAGPSGAGKTTLLEALFGPAVARFDWPRERAVVDGFPPDLGIKEVIGHLARVGFNSPPAWLLPFHALSRGEQFRATLARGLAEAKDLVAIDEFASSVDATVARIGSAAVARAVRAGGPRLVVATCREEVEEWLGPDWILDARDGAFRWRSVRPRPEIRLTVRRVGREVWPLFARHHYLTGRLHPSASCFLGTVWDRPACFTATLPFPHPRRPGWREHRTVVLPEFQGLGLGTELVEYVASLYRATGRPYRCVTGHPALVRRRANSPLWRMTRRLSLARPPRLGTLKQRAALWRLTGSFEYVGPARAEDARAFGIVASEDKEPGMGDGASCPARSSRPRSGSGSSRTCARATT